MKKLVSLLLAAVMAVACLCPAAMAANDIGVQVNGKAVLWTDAKPFIDSNNRTLVPLRAVADAMGLEVSWDQSTRTAAFSGECVNYDNEPRWQSIRFRLGSSVAETERVEYIWWEEREEVVSDTIQMDTAAVIVDGRTYAPIRYLAEFFGYDVSWNAADRIVVIEPAYIRDFGQMPITEETFAFSVGAATGFDQVSDIRLVRAWVNGTEADSVRASRGGMDADAWTFVVDSGCFASYASVKLQLQFILADGKTVTREYLITLGDYSWMF